MVIQAIALPLPIGHPPPTPLRARISPGARLRPSTSRRGPSEAVALKVSESAAMSAPSPEPAGSRRLVRPLTASLARCPWRTEIPARSPGVPSVGSTTKYPPFVAAKAPVRAEMDVRV